MRKIHPFDVYVESNGSGRYVKDTGSRIDIPIFNIKGEFLYNAQGHVIILNGEMVLETTTVKPITTELT